MCRLPSSVQNNKFETEACYVDVCDAQLFIGGDVNKLTSPVAASAVHATHISYLHTCFFLLPYIREKLETYASYRLQTYNIKTERCRTYSVVLKNFKSGIEK